MSFRCWNLYSQLDYMSLRELQDCTSSDDSNSESQDLAEVKAELDGYLSKDFGQYDINFDLLTFWQVRLSLVPFLT